jgi:hypothetical protein
MRRGTENYLKESDFRNCTITSTLGIEIAVGDSEVTHPPAHSPIPTILTTSKKKNQPNKQTTKTKTKSVNIL